MKKKLRNRKIEARKKRRRILIGGCTCAVILIGICISYFVLRGYVNRTEKDKICDHIFIESVDVSGMKKEEAQKAVEKKVKEYQAEKIALCVEDNSVEMTLGELGFKVKETDKLVQEAMDYGKSGNVWSRYQKIKKLEKEQKEIKAVYVIEKAKAEAVLKEKALPLERTAQNAAIARENGAFVITDEQKGQTLDIKASMKAIEKYLNKKWDKKTAKVTLVSVEDEPRIKRADLEVIQDTLGTFTTNCGSGGGRVQNIVSGAEHINGAILMPGDEFSADAAMRPYTFENGYAEAGSYENGQVVQSMGGGICQVSSTLYNAVILSELEVTQRMPHSMLVGYVKPSMDAAIAGDYKDLKFKNNTEFPIYIEGYVSGGYITFSIYGKEVRPQNRTIEFISETLSTQEAGKKFVASGAALGAMQSGGSPHIGKKAQLWKVVYEDGKEVSREVFNKSSYSASPTIISVGTASDNAAASAKVSAAIATQDEATIRAAIAAANAMIEEAKKPQETPPADPPADNNQADPPAENSDVTGQAD